VAYFDQLREQLDPEKTLSETVSPGSTGSRSRGNANTSRVTSATSCFRPGARTRRSACSRAAERNRLLLARLFARPANVLVLDEPTNDLDIDSLELLETLLLDYTGTLLLVSHDRAFLDNVVTQTVAAEGEGRWREYVGGYTDWLRQRPQPKPVTPKAGDAARACPVAAVAKRKLSYKEQRELESLPGEIEQLELEQQQLARKMGGADYHRVAPDEMRRDGARAVELETLIAERTERWITLEDRT
jgi:ATP-binding cassette subfamily F protein uup